MGKIIGIDLGTTMSVVAIVEGGEPKVIPNEEGERLTPSVVAWDERGQVLVGTVARRQAIVNPENTIHSVKRFMGRRHAEVAEETGRVSYHVVPGPDGEAAIDVRGRRYSPPEISARVLGKLKRAAEAYLGHTVQDAVITVPAYFNDAQRQATKDAGRIAGLEVKRIINEPTAAALAYGLDKKREEKIAVYDFGGGTFDISLLEVGEGVIEVIATNGDTHLGGDDLDARVVDWVVAEFKRETGIDASKDRMALQRIRDAAEKARVELSSTLETQINLPFLSADAAGPKHLMLRLGRAKLEQLIGDLIARSFEPVRQALADAALEAKDIDEVVLVGGVTRTPLVQERVTEVFGKEPHKGVNPDEVVALGAAVQGGVLSGEVGAVLLLDVTPLSLGIETLGGVTTALIPRNTTIPVRKSETFTTAADNQPSVEVHVVQGERPLAADNRTLGRFHLMGIAPAPRGTPQIEVTFDLDANGILHVSAKDKSTGAEQRIQVSASGGLSKEEVDRLAREAEAHRGEDEHRRKAIDARNQLDGGAYAAERLIGEQRARLSSETVRRLQAAIEGARRLVEGRSEDLRQIEQAQAELVRASGAASEELQRAPRGEAEEPAGRQGPIDAEFEEQPPGH